STTCWATSGTCWPSCPRASAPRSPPSCGCCSPPSSAPPPTDCDFAQLLAALATARSRNQSDTGGTQGASGLEDLAGLEPLQLEHLALIDDLAQLLVELEDLGVVA